MQPSAVQTACQITGFSPELIRKQLCYFRDRKLDWRRIVVGLNGALRYAKLLSQLQTSQTNTFIKMLRILGRLDG